MSVRLQETELLRLYLFGTPRAERDEVALPIRRRKGAALLTYLAVTGQPHTREALATLLWPEQEPSTALANLRRDLARLRQDVGDLFDADRLQIGLAAGVSLWVDVEQFHEHLSLVRSHGHLPDQPCDACLAALTDAVALYTADFLSGFTLPDSPQWDEWHFFQAEALRQRFGRALQTLIAWHVRQGEYAAAIPYAQRWVALDPLEESAHRTLMRLFAWNGQHAAALRQYDEARRLLHEEMGVPPDEETDALIQQIRARQLATPDTASMPELTPTMPPQARYVREQQLAVGGQGEVVLARDQVTGRAVILKRLRAELGREQPEQVARFLREAEILRRLRHPNIVQFLDSYDDGGRHVIVMEYVAGGTLRDLLRRDGPLPVERVVSIGLELADALGRAHHLGIVHRDLKPGNILLAEDGTPRLTDFGVARLEQAETRLTQTGAFVGSPAYMSPEAVRGEPLDGRSDVWSLGVLLWELLAGHRLYEGTQIPPILVDILQAPVPNIRAKRPSVPEPLAILLERMLVKERDRRVGSMRQVAAALEAIRAGETVEFLTPSPMPSPRAAGQATPSSTLARRPFAPVDQQIRFTRSADGTRIAYAVVGEGPPLVKVANPLTHLQYDWESPVWRHWVEGLSQSHTLIRYDERGCGLSERNVTRFSIDAWVEDLEAVVDDLGLERFPIIGTSQGPSVAIAYTVRHPDRVSHLIFCGGYARGRFRRGNVPDRTEGEMLLSLIRFGWGQDTPVFRRVFASLFVPEGTPEQLDWFTELARVTTHPEIAALMEQAFYELDVSDLAPQIMTPTLVMHPRGDAMIPFEEGKLIADLIPNARFVPLDSQNHILLEDEPAWTHFLEEVRSFLKTANPASHPSSPAPDEPELAQQIYHTTSQDDVRIAYAISGSGPPLVKASNWLSHLEFDWQSPVWRHWLEALSRRYTLIRYDERGCGLSAWDVEEMSFEAWVRDLEAVVDAVALERFPLLGISQGAAIAIAYAVRHPERVSHLVLYGGFARGKYHRQQTPEQAAEARTLIDLIRIGWGKDHAAFRQVFASLFLPEGTAEQFQAFNELQRMSCTPENAARIVDEFSDIEVTHLARQVTTPTLILHAEGDLDIPVAEGKMLAELIPSARFVPLQSSNHILQAGQAAFKQFLGEVEGFLATVPPPPPIRD